MATALLIVGVAACGGTDATGDGEVPTTAVSTTEAPATTPPSTDAPATTTTTEVPETTTTAAEGPPGEVELVWSFTLDDVLQRVSSLAVSPDGTTVAVGSAVMYVYQLADGELLDVIVHWGTGPSDLAYSPEGSLLAAGFLHGRVALTTPDGSVPDGLESLQQFDGFAGAYLAAGSNDTTVAFSADGAHLATSSRTGVIQIWNLADGEELTSFEAPDADDRRAGVSLTTTVLEFHPSGEAVGAVDFDCNLHVWDVGTGQAVHAIDMNRIGCSLGTTFRFAPAGEVMAGAVRNEAGEQVVRIWTVDEADVVMDLPVGERNFNDLSFSPDTSMLVTSSDSGSLAPPVIWDVATGTQLYELESPIIDGAPRLTALQFTPDGGHVVVGYQDGTVELWRLPGTEELVAPEREPCDPVPIPGDVLFDTGSSALRPAADAVLTELAEQLATGFPVAALTFVGHTDSRGAADSNLQLSIDRADAVRAWFESWAAANGVDGWALLVEGRGDTELRVPDTDADGNFLTGAGALNRRVEIEIEADACRP